MKITFKKKGLYTFDIIANGKKIGTGDRRTSVYAARLDNGTKHKSTTKSGLKTYIKNELAKEAN